MNKRYKHILVPLDGSELAELALDDAFSLAELSQAEVTLLQVILPIEKVTAGENDHPIYVDEQWKNQQQIVLDYLNRVCERMKCGNLLIHKVVEMGQPASTIIDYSHEHPTIDLIVMATHGHSGLKRWVYGSVAGKILRGAGLPILLVRAHHGKEAR